MKPISFLNTISQPCPNRTSFHAHIQSTAYHYNSILNAKSQIDNKHDHSVYFKTFKNKYTNNLNAEIANYNKKVLKSLVDIDQHYSLYGPREEESIKKPLKGNSVLIWKGRSNCNEFGICSPQKVKTLKNLFVSKMQKLRISEQNVKFYEKITNASSSVLNNKQLKQWNRNLKKYSSIIDSSRLKQPSQSLTKHLFSTFIKLRQSPKPNRNAFQTANSLVINSEINTIPLQKKKINHLHSQTIKQQTKVKSKRKKNKFTKRFSTTPNQTKFQSQNSSGVLFKRQQSS